VKSISSFLRKVSQDSKLTHWSKKLYEDFGLKVYMDRGVYDSHLILRQIYGIFQPVSKDLIKDCGVDVLILRSTMGPNEPYYPNHGYYQALDKSITLNADIFYHPDQPDDFFDYKGYFISRAAQTLLHELGHALDAAQGDLSKQPEWLKLSGWSPVYQPGLKRLIIKGTGTPEVIGEWFYNPEIATFTRFYAKRSPWDDFADSFSFYVASLKDKVPPSKKEYFDNLLKKY
jgi:hypothetical protein